MNLEILYSKIKNPALLESSDISSFKELAAKYPFTQLFSILYLKALAQNKDLHFEDELQQHAFKITDRAKLYDLIHSNDSSTAEPIVTIPQVEEDLHILPTEKSEEQEEVKPEPRKTTHIPEVEYKEPIGIQSTSPIEFEKIQSDEEITPIQEIEIPHLAPENSFEEIQNEQAEKEMLDLEKEFLSNVIAASYSIEAEEAKAPKIEEKIDIHETRSFSSWLKVSHLEESKESNKIIEKFIQEEPERIKPKKDFYSAPKKAKESVSDEKLIYTETLANIFALQGNYPKAITAFKHLMLTIPEKKLYFAKKIEELNKKINS